MLLRHVPPGRRATATLEFAVIAPVLALLVLGMFEITRAVQVKNCLTDAARSSSRIAIQPGSNSQSVQDHITTVLTGNGLPSANATVTILVNGVAADVNTAKKYDKISVKISLPISKVEWVTLFYFTSSEVESEQMTMMHL
jgi:Flp pilus assembly protein TadG